MARRGGTFVPRLKERAGQSLKACLLEPKGPTAARCRRCLEAEHDATLMAVSFRQACVTASDPRC